MFATGIIANWSDLAPEDSELLVQQGATSRSFKCELRSSLCQHALEISCITVSSRFLPGGVVTTKNGKVSYYYRDKAGKQASSLNSKDQICLDCCLPESFPMLDLFTRGCHVKRMTPSPHATQGILTYVPMEDAIKALQ